MKPQLKKLLMTFIGAAVLTLPLGGCVVYGGHGWGHDYDGSGHRWDGGQRHWEGGEHHWRGGDHDDYRR